MVRDNVRPRSSPRKRGPLTTGSGIWVPATRASRGAPRRDDKPLSHSSRQKRAGARGRVGELLHRRAVEVFEPLAGENGADRTFRDALAFAQEIGAVGRAQRVVGIVGGE